MTSKVNRPDFKTTPTRAVGDKSHLSQVRTRVYENVIGAALVSGSFNPNSVMIRRMIGVNANISMLGTMTQLSKNLS